jgi:hypothetical protein
MFAAYASFEVLRCRLLIRAVGSARSDQLPPLLRDAAIDVVAAIGILDAEVLFFLRASRLVPEDLLGRLDALETAT